MTNKKTNKEPEITKPDTERTPKQLILLIKKKNTDGWENRWIGFFLGIAYGLIISKVVRTIYDQKENAKTEVGGE